MPVSRNVNWKRIGRTLLALAGVAIFLVILRLGGTEALSRVVHGDPLYVLATLLAVGGVTLSSALRWRILVSALTGQPALPLYRIYYYNIIGRLIGLFAPRGVGDLAGRPLALRAGGASSLGMALYSTLLDRLFDYLLLALMTGPALLFVGRIVSLGAGSVLAATLLAGGFVVLSTRFGGTIEWLTAVLGKGALWISRMPAASRLIPQDKVAQMRQLKTIEVDAWTVARVYLLTVLHTLMAVLRSYFVARALRLRLPFLLLALAAPVAQLGQLLAFTPGALGIRELSWFAVLQATGVPRDDVLAFLMGHRAYVYVAILALALIGQLTMLAWPQRANQQPPAAGGTERSNPCSQTEQQ
jgi:uncharacterized protein (TIRG00374 family)